MDKKITALFLIFSFSAAELTKVNSVVIPVLTAETKAKTSDKTTAQIERQDGVYSENKRGKLVIDHDGGADDAMAIFIALLSERYFNGPNVVALTTTHGNVNESQSFLNSQRILDIAERREVTIYRGSSQSLVNSSYESDYFFGYDGLGDQDYVTLQTIEADEMIAALALIELSKQYEGRLTVVATGAMTNIALAIRVDPDFIDRLSQLYVVAGNIYGENHLQPEFNALMDVEAYHIIAENAKPEKVTTVPFSGILDTLNITVDWRLNVLGAVPTQIIKELNGFEQVSIPKVSVWSLLDPSAMAVVLNESLVTDSGYSKQGITLCGSERGINTNDFDVAEINTRVIKGVNETLYKQFLIDIFSAELNDIAEYNLFYLNINLLLKINQSR